MILHTVLEQNDSEDVPTFWLQGWGLAISD